MKKILIAVAVALSIPFAAMADQGPANKHQVKGSAAQASAAQRTVHIQAKTKYVHVNQGDTIKFVVGDKTFAWHFDTLRASDNFQLAAIAPAGIDTHRVRVYVAPNPLYNN